MFSRREYFSTETAKIRSMMTTNEVLSRWVDQVYPTKEEFLTALEKRKLKIYLGVDPTGPDLHLGHSTNLLLLKYFQELGHKIIFLIGDFTAMIGDPTGREESRKKLSQEEVRKNGRKFKEQAGKIIKFSGSNPAALEFNSRWWGKMTLSEGLSIGYNFTLQQLIERDMFQKRLKRNEPISFPEAFYPILQGYDSVALDVDVEVGGTDQTFNMLAGRELLKKLKGKEKFVITTTLLENPKTGKKLMSKTEGNYVGLSMLPQDMFGAVMALPDEAVVPVFELCTEVPSAKIAELKNLLVSAPVKAKKTLALEITRIYHGDKRAEESQKEFEGVFSRGGTPEDAPVWKVAGEKIDLVDLLAGKRIVGSKSEARRLIEQGGVTLNRQKLTNPEQILSKGVLRIGKKTFIKIE